MQIGPYTAREHQVAMFEESRAAIGDMLRGREKPYLLMVLPTGGGKTIYSSLIMAYKKEGARIAFLVSGRELAFQKSRKLSECGIAHSLMMANVDSELRDRHDGLPESEHHAREYNKFDPPDFHDILVISKDTLESREIEFQHLGISLIIVDEAHQSLSSKWLKIIDLGIPVIGMTGTPIDGKGRGLPFYERMIVGATFRELIDKSYLVDCRIKIPFTVELKRGSGDMVDIGSNGEFVQSQLSEVYDNKDIIGDAIEAWKEHADNRPTMVYASSVEHAIALKHAFNEEGVPAEHVEADTSQKDRQAIYDRYRNGETKVLTNYGILITGVDFPCTEVVQFLVSINSLSRFLQACGRAARPYTNEETGYAKSHFTIIDHGGNVAGHDGYEKHGSPSDDRVWPEGEEDSVVRIDKNTNKPVEAKKKAAVCPKCKFEKGGQKKCPSCGYEYQKSGIMLRTAKAEFKEIDPKTLKKKKEVTGDQQIWSACLGKSAAIGLPVAAAAAMYKRQTGKKYLPADIYPQPEPQHYRMKVAAVWPGFKRGKK